MAAGALAAAGPQDRQELDEDFRWLRPHFGVENSSSDAALASAAARGGAAGAFYWSLSMRTRIGGFYVHVESMDDTPGKEDIENRHCTNIKSPSRPPSRPPPPPHLSIRGRLFRAGTQPTLNILLLLVSKYQRAPKCASISHAPISVSVLVLSGSTTRSWAWHLSQSALPGI